MARILDHVCCSTRVLRFSLLTDDVISTRGNLGRAGYGASLDGMWVSALGQI
jgi:hypothetical protein